jgi:hypothetical protein
MLFTARRFPFGGRRPGPPRPAPDGAGPRLKKTPGAAHTLPQGQEGRVDPISTALSFKGGEGQVHSIVEVSDAYACLLTK